ncbi:MAG: Gfo/Idh/MocA family oxidoreductase, partial [Clostridia bacterium]|nr:Gfo/Idh/MocA family oxidoreductase [Clostridia bacterium]
GRMLEEDDIDAVDVCLHNNMHAPVSIAVMRAGKDCYCEKPMAGTFYDARRMYQVMEETGKKLHIQLSLLYTRETKAAKRFIDAGKLGHLYHMRSYGFRRRGRPYVDGYAAKEFVNTTTSGGGALFDMGVYHISQLLYLAGLPRLERVSGHTYAQIAMDPGRREISGFNVEELGVGLATYEGGLSMDILESWAIHGRPFPSSILCGSEAGISLEPLTIHSRENDIETDTTVDLGQMDYLEHTVYAADAHYDNSQHHWIHALLSKCDLLPTAKIALETQRVQEGIYFSQKLGREVTADEIETLSESKALEIPNL